VGYGLGQRCVGRVQSCATVSARHTRVIWVGMPLLTGPGSTLRPIGSHGGLALLCTLSLCQLRPCGTWLRVCVRLCVPLHQHTAQRNCSPDHHKIHRVPTLLGVGTPPPADPELLLLLWVVVVPTFHHPAASPSLGRNWMVARLRTGCDSSDTPVYWACPQS